MLKLFKIRVLLLIGVLLVGLVKLSYSQGSQTEALLGDRLNTITTAVPFLMVAPDSRAGALGDAGVSTTPDVNSQHWNPAKYAFIEKDMGFSLSYSPWLRALVNDISLAYLSGYKRINDNSAISASLLFFSLGEIVFKDADNQSRGTFNPNEFAIDVAYSRKFSKHFSMAVAGRYIYSNLTQGQFVGNAATHAGNSVAADIALYYQKEFKWRNGLKGMWGLGANISNIGAKISYSDNVERDFIPTNLRIGPSFTLDLDDYNRLSFTFDLNKLLVPTPPIWTFDSVKNEYVVLPGNGKDPRVGIVTGMIQSFYDAPNGFKEEMQEINFAIGAEYWYDQQFAVRVGYFYENKYKGNRKFFTLGAGFKYSVFGLDFAYLIPVDQRNPLENTLRFTLLFDFDAFKGQDN